MHALEKFWSNDDKTMGGCIRLIEHCSRHTIGKSSGDVSQRIFPTSLLQQNIAKRCTHCTSSTQPVYIRAEHLSACGAMSSDGIGRLTADLRPRANDWLFVSKILLVLSSMTSQALGAKNWIEFFEEWFGIAMSVLVYKIFREKVNIFVCQE